MKPIKILEPLKKTPFTLMVFTRLLVLIPIFGMSVLMIVSSFDGILKADIIELPTFLLGLAFFILSSSFLIKIVALEKIRLSQLQYLLYSDRLVIYNKKKDLILHELFYHEFPEFTFHESLTNYGYIVIGKNEPIMTKGGIFGQNIGVNLKNPKMMLENLSEVKKVYLFLEELITNAKAK